LHSIWEFCAEEETLTHVGLQCIKTKKARNKSEEIIPFFANMSHGITIIFALQELIKTRCEVNVSDCKAKVKAKFDAVTQDQVVTYGEHRYTKGRLELCLTVAL
jgi:hypothetical protein